MRRLAIFLSLIALVAGVTGRGTHAQQVTVDTVIGRIFQREGDEVKTLRQYQPVIEVYVQDLSSDNNPGSALATDHYFLGNATLGLGTAQEPSKGNKEKHHEAKLGGLSDVFPKESVLDGFSRTTSLDSEDFDRQHYHLDYVRREFLGKVRCLVFDVTPLSSVHGDHFAGRIWVEDQTYTIVRINGGLVPGEHPKGFRLRYDSWRVNVAPGVWVPDYVYAAEAEAGDMFLHHVRFQAQVRLWGYNSKRVGDVDRSAEASERARERETEAMVMDSMETAGLLAPVGSVDKVVCTVVNNFEVTNNLDIEPDVDCRTLLTSTLESFTVGHTLVISRGLLDVLPDEASLAVVVAHQLGHILNGNALGDLGAVNRWTVLPPEDSFNHFGLALDPHAEEAANVKARELLEKSPYKDKMGTAVLFFGLIDSDARTLSNLISPEVASEVPLAKQWTGVAAVPATGKGQPIAALPLGSRIDLDPWSDEVQFMTAEPISLAAGHERQPFRLSPYMPSLIVRDAAPDKTDKH